MATEMHTAHHGCEITMNPILAGRTTMRLGGEAVAEIKVSDPVMLAEVPELAEKLGGRAVPLGRGSNLLVREGKLDLIVVSLDAGKKIEFFKDETIVKADADVNLPLLLSKTAEHGLSGLEGLSGIPGSVGGSMRMNAGSYGVSLGDRLIELEAFSPETGLRTWKPEELDLAYRHCEPKIPVSWFMITKIALKLEKDDPAAIKAKMKEIFEKKKASQPVNAHSAGCIFKNPSPEKPAGKLLDEAGMRGKKIGGMLFSQIHANFLVNDGNGTFVQAEELIETARSAVKDKFGLGLELEVRIWP